MFNDVYKEDAPALLSVLAEKRSDLKGRALFEFIQNGALDDLAVMLRGTALDSVANENDLHILCGIANAALNLLEREELV